MSYKHFKKKLIPQGVNYVTNAPTCRQKSIVINRPIEVVWSVIDDTPGYVNWFPGLKWGKFEDPNDTGMGAKRLAQLNSYKYYEEMIIYKPPNKWGFTMLEANTGACKSISEVITLDKISDTETKVTYQGGYEFQGFFKLMKGMLEKNIDGIWTKALKGLKSHCENK